MKKIVWYIPLAIFTAFYGFVAIMLSDISIISPIVLVWLGLFTIAGILLSKAIGWGSLLGILPAIHLIYMGTKETGQIVNIEIPLGIAVLLFYGICGYLVSEKKKMRVSGKYVYKSGREQCRVVKTISYDDFHDGIHHDFVGQGVYPCPINRTDLSLPRQREPKNHAHCFVPYNTITTPKKTSRNYRLVFCMQRNTFIGYNNIIFD